MLKGPAKEVAGPPDFFGVFLEDCAPDFEFSCPVTFWADLTMVVSYSSLDSIEATMAAIGLTSQLLGLLVFSSPMRLPPLLCSPRAMPLSLSISAVLAAFSN